MRTILILCGGILVLAAGYFFWSRSQAQHFGAPFSGVPAVAVKDLIEHPADYVQQTITIEGTVQRQCPVSGCYFFFKEGAKELKIELGDTLPVLPKKSGRHAQVEGQLLEMGGKYVFIGSSVAFGGTNARIEDPPAAKPPEAPAPVTKTAEKSGYPLDTCVVSGEQLGEMGEPYAYAYQGRTVKFCCKACQKDFDADPAKYLKKLDAAAQQQVH